MALKYYLETYGCQMNVHDGERLSGLLETHGYQPATSDADADVVIVNTCSVRERAEEKLFSRLGEIRLSAAGRPQVIAVTGCVAQQEGERLFKRDRSIDVVVGTQSLKELPRLLTDHLATRQRAIDVHPHDDVSFPLGVARASDAFRASITIIEGCNEFCSFCVVPYTRGHERMRPVADILAEARAAVASGRIELLLLGQIVNHYEAPDDPTCDFAELLRRVAALPGVARLRFASPHPRYVTERLIDVMCEVPNVCRHLHMPLQSGSNTILQAMRRRHTRESYLSLVAQLRARMPTLSLTTDVIVGFPGESEADFELTLDMVTRLRFEGIYSFKYSPRPNTLAFKRLTDDVPEAEKTRRIVMLQQTQRDIQQSLHEAAVGQVVEVLTESVSRRREHELAGRTPGNLVVNFPGPSSLIGTLVQVRLTGAAPNSLRGELVSPAPTTERGLHVD